MVEAYRYANPRSVFVSNEKRYPFKLGLLFCFVILETYTYLLRKGRLHLRIQLTVLGLECGAPDFYVGIIL